jgi:hypothetical protein
MKSAMKFYAFCASALVLFACGMPSDPLECSDFLSSSQSHPDFTQLPQLTAGPTGPALLWVTTQLDLDSNEVHALRWARWSPDSERWVDTVEIASGADWMVNWADRPSLAFADSAQAWAHWLAFDLRAEQGEFAYGVRAVRSMDGGRTWSEPSTPHRDTAVAEHGFGRWLPQSDGATLVWLDGRDFDGHLDPSRARMEVRAANWPAGEDWSAESVLDSSACTCCPLSDTPWRGGHVVAFRDRDFSPTGVETRDFSLVFQSGLSDEGKPHWSAPTPLSPDGWELSGCPVNGAAISANQERMLAVWFTAADDSARVMASHSSDGRRFSEARQLNLLGRAVGRVASCTDGRGCFYAVWLEAIKGGTAMMGVQWSPAGQLQGEPRELIASSSQRTAGFPTMTGLDNGALIAWTVPGDLDADANLTAAAPHIQTAVWQPNLSER